jgi:hypothetical protein
MNRRLIISLLCAGALAFACGPRSRTQTPQALASALPVPIKSLASPRSSARSRESRNDTKVDSRLLVSVAKHTVRFALQVKNVGHKHVELTFPSGQAYDFTVLDASGREVWRWSSGRMFTQGIQNRLLGTGESMNADATRSAGAATGRYTVVATLKSTNFPSEQRSEFALP